MKAKAIIGHRQEINILVMVFVLIAFISILNPKFLRYDNLLIIIKWTAVLSILAIGESFVLLIGGIDLSIGSVITLTNMLIAGLLSAYNMPLPLAIFLTLATASLIGLGQGLLAVKFSPPLPLAIPSFIITLAMNFSLYGLVLGVSGGNPIYGLPRSYSVIGMDIGPLPVPVLILVVIVIAVFYILHKSKLGVYIYAIGGNLQAAIRSGINVNRVRMFCFSFSSFLAGLTGIIIGSILLSGNPLVGPEWMLLGIAAAVIGGVSLAGGEGTFIGPILGSLALQVIDNGLVVLYVNPLWRDAAIGGLFLSVTLYDFIRRKKALLGM